MKYNFIGEDEHTFTVRHPDGSEFNIAKQAVGPGVHKLIKGLEPIKMDEGGIVDKSQDILKGSQGRGKTGSIFTDPNSPVVKSIGKAFGFAEGGEVPEMDEDIAANKDQEMRAPAEINSIDSFKNMVLGTDQAQSLASIQDLARSPQNPLIIEPAETINPETNPTSPKSSAQVMPESMSDAYANNFALKGAGIQGVADAQSQAGKQQAAAYQAQADQIAKSQAHYEQAHAALDSEHKQLTDAVMNDKLDPNRLFHNMSTGNKVLAAISVALGGLGSGLNGKSNVAMDVIQKSIDRDIDAQKTELGKKHTLLSENLRRFGDLNTATQMTQLQMNAMTQAKVSQAASQSGSAQAQAQANMMLGDLGLQATQIKQQIALAQTQAKSLGLGGKQGGLPVGQEPFQLLSDPKYQEKRVQIDGRAYQAADKEAATKIRQVESHAGPVLNMIKQLDQLGPSATIPGTAANEQAETIRAKLGTEIPLMNGLNRINETEIHQAGQMIKDPTAFKQIMNGGIRNNQFVKQLEEELESSRKQNLIGYVAKEPAPEIAIKDGKKYQKVSGGWKKI